MKRKFIRKDPDAGKDRKQKEKGTAEDEVAGWDHQLNEHELNRLHEIVKDREVWHAAVRGVAELDMTEGLNNSCIAGRFFLPFEPPGKLQPSRYLTNKEALASNSASRVSSES